ncbi:hypothetical protein DNHGIG_31380 [Collibacillus ludicampi]|uniref:Uncharacterized protein n=1 Tax=Collibacillus ludicampi TaxID=2771369 RepID=A0AAV4LJI4_9BACL|nr:hypothetical protein [Collibacillus ludicampi]GIM47589.1 hypothetical protein DNHGIG_31380 [Collibacillus ludicampi]
MNAAEAVGYYEKQICEWCSFRQAGLLHECVRCPIEIWKQAIITEEARLYLQKRRPDAATSSQELG